MTQKLNCWQYNNCGREAGGLLADVLGVCPVSLSMKHDGANGGQAAGRVCWRVSRASQRREISATGLGKPCHQCTFFIRVRYEEEGESYATGVTTIETPATCCVSKSS
jgi:hypothetical protein